MSSTQPVSSLLTRRSWWTQYPPGLRWALLWGLLNLIQAIGTELIHDEAYYWTWSQELAWIYAEHPPMVAWVIWLGGYLFPGELGVRLIPLLMGSGTIYLLWDLCEAEGKWLFPAIISAVIGLHVGTWLAVPETPFVFFATLFLWQYRRFLQRDRWVDAFWLSLCIVGLLYSKYHGMMLLGMVLLSQLGLLRRAKFWAIVSLSALLLSPLLYELVSQQFETLSFHLLERNRRSWDWHYVGNFFSGQLGLAGPIVSLLLIPAAVARKPQDQFERSLRFVLFGVWGFLFLMSWRVWIEANWASSALIPMLILATRYLSRQKSWQKWLFRLAWPSLLVVLLVRGYFLVDWLSPLGGTPPRQELHNWDTWAETLAEISDGKPVLIINSYGHPAKYWFYSGQRAYSFSTPTYHRNQFDAWGRLDSLRGKDVYWWTTYRPSIYRPDSVMMPGFPTWYYRVIPDFQAYEDISLLPLASELVGKQGDTISVVIQLQNEGTDWIDFQSNKQLRPVLHMLVHQGGPWQSYGTLGGALSETGLQDSLQVEVPLVLSWPPGTYHAKMTLQPGYLPIGNQMRGTIPLIILPPESTVRK